jgi:hypothetical protein
MLRENEDIIEDKANEGEKITNMIRKGKKRKSKKETRKG